MGVTGTGQSSLYGVLESCLKRRGLGIVSRTKDGAVDGTLNRPALGSNGRLVCGVVDVVVDRVTHWIPR